MSRSLLTERIAALEDERNKLAAWIIKTGGDSAVAITGDPDDANLSLEQAKVAIIEEHRLGREAHNELNAAVARAERRKTAAEASGKALADDLRAARDMAKADGNFATAEIIWRALAVVQEIERAPPDHWLNDSSRQGARQRLKAAREMLAWRDRLLGMLD